MKREIISVYRSSKNADTYLYVIKKAGLKALPDALKALFGTPIHVLDMLLTPEKKLARTTGEKVLTELAEKGFYLQMPPPKEDYMLDLYREKTKSDHG